MPERSRLNTGEPANVFFSFSQPPGNTSPSIQAGKELTLDRSITLTKNSQFYVRHGDVERLIAQGYLQRLS
jgi:hypothetical protein